MEDHENIPCTSKPDEATNDPRSGIEKNRNQNALYLIGTGQPVDEDEDAQKLHLFRGPTGNRVHGDPQMVAPRSNGFRGQHHG